MTTIYLNSSLTIGDIYDNISKDKEVHFDRADQGFM